MDCHSSPGSASRTMEDETKTVESLDEFDEVDRFFDDDKYEEALARLRAMPPPSADDVETRILILWRLTIGLNLKAHHVPLEERRGVLLEGAKFAREAYALQPRDVDVLRNAAIIIGSLAEMAESTKERIHLGHEFKKYLDEALSMKDDDFPLFHMRGRFNYTVAGLSWVERTAAALLFATPPTATYADAVEDLEKVRDSKPEEMPQAYVIEPTAVDNLLFLAKAHIAMGKKTAARKYLEELLQQEAENTVEAEQKEQARDLLATLN